MPRPEQFNFAARIDPDEAVLARTFIPAPVPHELSIAEISDKYNKQIDEDFHGIVGTSSARRENSAASAMMAERVNRHTMTSASIDATIQSNKIWGSLSQTISTSHMAKWAAGAREQEWDKHRSAAQRVEVSPNEVLLNEQTGLPMTRAELAAAGDEECLYAVPLEDLVISAEGIPVMNASGTHYMSHYNIEVTEVTLNRAIMIDDIADKIEQIENGALPPDALTQEEVTVFLSDQTSEERNAYYQGAGFSEAEISEVEGAVQAYKDSDISTLWGQLGDPRMAMSYDFSIDSGGVTLDDITNPSSAFAGVAREMTPVTAKFASPVTVSATSISLQNNMESPAFQTAPAPAF